MSTRVLCVNDDRHVQRDLPRRLPPGPSRWSLEFAETADRALECLERSPFGVVVSDSRVPGIGGVELLRLVRARYPDTTRVLVAGRSDREAILGSLGLAHRTLPKPWAASLLRVAVEAAGEFRAQVSDDGVRTALLRLAALPVAEPARQALAATLGEPRPSLARLGAIVGQDPGLTAQVLRLCNSPCFGSGPAVASAGAAVTILGTDALRTMAGTLDDPPAAVAGPAIAGLLEHGLAVGRLAREIAVREEWPTATAAEAFTAGLLHDVGHLLLALAPRARAPLGVRPHATPGHPAEGGRQPWSAGHADLAAALLRLWGLPAALVEAVGYHHRPSLTPQPWRFGPMAAVHLADALLHAQEPGATLSIDARYVEALGLGHRLGEWARLTGHWSTEQSA